MTFAEVVEVVGKVVDAAGVAAIVVGALYATFLSMSRRREGNVYRLFRRRLGRSILLGLELLVAADIIRTVAVTPTRESLGGVAASRRIPTFLSFSLELEITGRWPWQQVPTESSPGPEAEPTRT